MVKLDMELLTKYWNQEKGNIVDRQLRGKEFKREPNSPLLSQDNFLMLVLQEKM